MFRSTSPQSSLFEVDQYLPDALPADDWCFFYQRHVLPLIDEHKFKHLYSDSEGRPNASIRLMVSLLIFMGLEKLHWRAVEFQFPRRLDWLIATRTPVGKASIDHTTLFSFFQRLEGDETARQLFTETADAFATACGTSLRKQRTDSFFIHGWLQLLSRYGLFRETIRKFLLQLRKQKPGIYKTIQGQLSRAYLETEFDLTEKDKAVAQRKIAQMAHDLYHLIGAFEHHRQVNRYETFKLLCTVFRQQCTVQESAVAAPEILIKDKPDSDTVCSPHNPDVRYVRKGQQRITGEKGFVTETCAADNLTQFLTDAEVMSASEPDARQHPHIQQRLIENEFTPDDHYADAGFVNGHTILAAQADGIALHGPTASRAQSPDVYTDAARALDAGDFDMRGAEPTETLHVIACPTKQAPRDQHHSTKTGSLIVHFHREVCAHCPDVQRCPVRLGRRVATFTVDKAAYVGAARHHHYMTDRDYRKQCATRAGAEATVSELTRAHGMRKSRHRPTSRTRLQLIFAALACNVKRFIRHGQQYGFLAPHFA